jgi:hypothetical protein
VKVQFPSRRDGIMRMNDFNPLDAATATADVLLSNVTSDDPKCFNAIASGNLLFFDYLMEFEGLKIHDMEIKCTSIFISVCVEEMLM